MPIGYIETEPKGQRTPKCRYEALAVNEIHLAKDPANERPFLVIKERVSVLADEIARQVETLSGRLTRVEKDVAWARALGLAERPAVEARAVKDTRAAWRGVLGF
jgi:hypothetical protein